MGRELVKSEVFVVCLFVFWLAMFDMPIRERSHGNEGDIYAVLGLEEEVG